MTKRRIDPATHVVADPGDKRSLCGVKHPMPVVLAAFVQRHVDGYGLVVCEQCLTAQAKRAQS